MKRRNFLLLAPALGLLACSGQERAFHNRDLSSQGVTPVGTLVGGDGTARRLEDFRGKLLIVHFGYTNSPETTPVALRKYASLIRNLRTRDAERVQFLFVSFDSERDSPAATDAYARLFNQSFVGLSADSDTINSFVTQFGAKFTKGDGNPYHFEYSNDAYVIDQAGRLRLALPPEALLEPIVADLQKLLAEK